MLVYSPSHPKWILHFATTEQDRNITMSSWLKSLWSFGLVTSRTDSRGHGRPLTDKPVPFMPATPDTVSISALELKSSQQFAKKLSGSLLTYQATPASLTASHIVYYSSCVLMRCLALSPWVFAPEAGAWHWLPTKLFWAVARADDRNAFVISSQIGNGKR